MLIWVVAGRAQNANHDLGFTDTPMLPGLPYHVHDPARPHPRDVTPGAEPGTPPSDAMVLLDGKSLSEWTFVPANGPPAPPLGWKLGNGYVEAIPRAEDSLVLQNHNTSVRFRNIWIRRLRGYDQ